MIKITYECETVDQAVQFLRGGMNGPQGKKATVPASQVVTEPSTAPSSAAAPVAAASKPERPLSDFIENAPTAAPKEPNKPVTVQPAPKAAPKADGSATEVAIRAALREVFNTKGAKIATEILKQFGAARISDVKPEQYADFIKACAA